MAPRIKLTPTATPTPIPTFSPVEEELDVCAGWTVDVGVAEVVTAPAGFGVFVDDTNRCVCVAATSIVSGTAQAVIGPETTVVLRMSSSPRFKTVVVDFAGNWLRQPAKTTVLEPPPVVSVVKYE